MFPRLRKLLLSGAVLTCALSALTATAAHADTTPAPIPVGGGSGIFTALIDDSTGIWIQTCTMTAVGHDAEGNLVGLTNAHCFISDHTGKQVPIGDKVYADPRPAGTALNEAPGVPSLADVKGAEATGPIGEVTYISTPNNLLSGGPNGPDYAVIKLDPAKVAPVSTVTSPSGSLTISSIGSLPGVGTRMCKQGHRTGLTCGILLGTGPMWFTSLIWTDAGDSGSPVVNGTTLVGNDWGAQHGTSIQYILADMNARGGIGAGFHLG